ncbi:WD repeat domain 20 isoform 3 [Planoprotostelium fungivorum]|uniref:WD repeat domain 20 isoform 3 n=1 Tax=Planoprotostelium fungivorum TaxID=1890364 RepID=A0A2P6NEA1_9EUKA|nr:WD repeat domain 20 isoform 3 [Planoprotostelium fungivorum]
MDKRKSKQESREEAEHKRNSDDTEEDDDSENTQRATRRTNDSSGSYEMVKGASNQSTGQILLGSPFKPVRPEFKSPEGLWLLLTSHNYLAIILNAKRQSKASGNPIGPNRLSFVTPKLMNPTRKLNNSGVQEVADHKESLEKFPILYAASCFDTLYVEKHSRYNEEAKKPQPEKTLRFGEVLTCVDVNHHSSTIRSVRLLLGFRLGDLFVTETGQSGSIQYDRISARGAVTGVSWVPESHELFVASFSSGIINVYDTTRGTANPPSNSATVSMMDGGFSITSYAGEKYNPVQKWAFSKSSVTDISFSPNGKFLAITSQDGFLRIVDFKQQKLLVSYRSNYGGFLCVTWSPDGKYLATGGEDDSVCVWSASSEYKCVARGRGHQSWVGRVCFDTWECSESHYRLASSGQDTKIVFWDFVESELRKPRSTSINRVRRSDDRVPVEPMGPKIVTTAFAEVPIMESVVHHRAHNEPISDIVFLEDGLATSCWGGLYKFWGRPGTVSDQTNRVGRKFVALVKAAVTKENRANRNQRGIRVPIYSYKDTLQIFCNYLVSSILFNSCP